jgi:hypothetical protein
MSFLSHTKSNGRIETDKNDKLLTYVNIEKYMENPDYLPPIEYKVVETVYDVDDEELDESESFEGNRKGFLRDELQSLDKNVLDFYGVVIDFDENGQQVARTMKKPRKKNLKRANMRSGNNSNMIKEKIQSTRDGKRGRSTSHHHETRYPLTNALNFMQGE